MTKSLSAYRTVTAKTPKGRRTLAWEAEYSGGEYIEIAVLRQPVAVINVFDYEKGTAQNPNPTQKWVGEQLQKWVEENRQELHYYIEQAEFQKANDEARA